MGRYAEAKMIGTPCPQGASRVEQHYSVEFAVDGLDAAYQFKIWNKTPTYMSILVKETSDVLPQLKVGDTLNMLYYSDDLSCPSEYLETTVRHIKKNEQGRLRGHYVVDVELLKTWDETRLSRGFTGVF